MASRQTKNKPVACPECGSQRLYKDGIRYTKTDQVQRYLCRNCGYRFSDPNRQISTSPNMLNGSKRIQKNHTQILKSMDRITSYRQICAAQPLGAKNLAAATKESESEKQAAGATEQIAKTDPADIKGKILEFAWWMKKQGYADATIEGRVQILKRLVRLGADLWNPESVKDIIAKQKWAEGRKFNATVAYTTFLQMHSLSWQPPRCRRIKKLPFIPLEAEIDQLIAACSRKISAFLQLLKETGIRSGEAWQLKWADLDLANNTLRVTPEKGSEPRIFKISTKLAAMLNSLPKNSEKIFGSSSIRSIRRCFQRQRERIAKKLENPRLLNITFHTLRHWKATMEYHRTKDILHVMKVLGHKRIQNTLIYTQLVNFQGEDEYICKAASTVDEAKQLIEAGFEYICDIEGVKLFRKRK
ncbi:MAG: tyrosine-type recombinase/integrase [Candidatus Bathyarchaeota archaeon]|nr:tyrosine-type recombinase/integrase [Candidatus Bathyarchaeota archaeon]